MDYSKSGAMRNGRNAPRHSEHNAKGSRKNPYGAQDSRDELLARMKAAAAARKGEQDDTKSE